MSTYLKLKRRRDIRRQRWQFIAVLATIGLGVMLFAASYDAYRNLEASYNGTYDRLNFADITIVGAPEGFAAEVASVPGVEIVETRRRADVPFRVDGDVLLGRVVGMPAANQPAINQIDIVDGTYLDPADPAGVVVETHMAVEFGLAPGDRIEILAGDAWVTAEVLGSAVSPEYIWPARSRQDIFPPPGTFGVLFVTDELLASAPATTAADETLITYAADADRDTTDAAVTSAAREAGAADVFTQAEQPSNETLQLDVQGFEQLAIAFPTLFMIAAGLAAFILLTRIVYSQRSQIGTLRANGYSRATLTRHYVSYGVLLGLTGAIGGLVLGMTLGWLITGAYTDSLGIPDTVRGLHPITPIIGLAFGLLTGSLAALAPARAVFRLSPAEAMRGDAPVASGSRSLIERIVPPLRRLPVRWLMVVRGIGRNKRRSISTVLGVILALTLVMVSWGMFDTVVVIIDRQFNEVSVEDGTAVLSVAVDAGAVATVAGVDGVTRAEPVVVLQASLGGAAASYSTELEGYAAGTQVHGFPDGLPAEGILAGSEVAGLLDVAIGDEVTVSFPTLGTSFSTTLAGFVDEPVGTFAYMELSALSAALQGADPEVPAGVLADPSVSQVKVLTDEAQDRVVVLDRVADLEQVAAVIDARELYDLVQDVLAFFYVFIGMMLLFGGAMAFALIFNTISVNVAERSGEFATMRANGLSHRGIARLIAAENLLLTAIGIVPGLVIGWLVASWFMEQYSSDLFSFSLQMRTSSIVLSALAMLVVACLSLIPALRSVRRLDIGAVVRERAV